MALSDNARPEATSTAPHGRVLRVVAIAALILTLAAAAGIVWLIRASAVPQTGALTAPEAYPPGEPGQVLAAADAEAAVPDLAAIMPDLLSDPRFDGDLSAIFADAASGEVLYERDARTPLTPASSMKLVTAVAAYLNLGPEFRIPTSVVAGPDEDTVVLVAGGDVTLTVDGEGYYGTGGSLTDLAEQVLEARGGEAPATVLLDESIFTGSELAEGVGGDDLPYTARTAPIMVDGGRIDNTQKYHSFYDDPAQAALEEFASLVGASGTDDGTAEEGAETLGTVYSQPVAGLVDSFVLSSDNGLSDAVALYTAYAVTGEMNWEAIDTVHRDMMAGFGADTDGLVFADGSGLSEDDRVTAEAFSALLLGAADSPASTVFESLPVAGYSGTLGDRFRDTDDGDGVVRAKTGTLSGVSSLTGSLTTDDGRLLVFSIMSNDHSNGWLVENAMDEVTAAVSQCGC